MSPRLLDLRTDPVDPVLLGEVIGHIRGGGLVAMPTETVYGFGCTLDQNPLDQMMRMKDREPQKPFLLLIPGVEAVAELEWTPAARELADVFWPGALTLILRDPGGNFPSRVRNPAGGVAIRVSPHPLARLVLEGVGLPLVSTSANHPGGKPALDAARALEVAEALGGGEELWVLDGGPLEPSEPSTIVDFSGAEPIVRRAGAIATNRLRCVLPEIHD